MSTPAAYSALVALIRERFVEARKKTGNFDIDSSAISLYAAQYNEGYADALGELLESVTGDPAQFTGEA